MTSPEHVRLALGAYALGTLEPAEHDDVERHLAGCPACTAELDELLGVVPLLDRIEPRDLEMPEPSGDLFARVRDQLDAENVAVGAEVSTTDTAASVTAIDAGRSHAPSRRRVLTSRWLLAAAAVVVIGGGATAIGLTEFGGRPASVTASAANGSVHLQVTATSVENATQLDVRVQGLPENERCHMVAIASDGSRHDAGSWSATYEGRAELTESTDVPRSELQNLVLYGSTGTTLATLTF